MDKSMKFTHRLITLSLLLTLGGSVQAQSIQSIHSILSFGAKGDGKTMNTRVINQAIQLLQNVTLHLEPGAVLMGSTNLDDYPAETGRSGESPRAGLLTARNAANVALTGRGCIEGNGMSFVDPGKLKLREELDYDKKYTRQQDDFMDPKYGTQDGPLAPRERPGNLVRFFNCTNVLISGLTIQNSPVWTVEVADCERVNITGVAINSLGSNRRVPNDDGMDLLESHDVHVSDCDIQTGDDCIAVLGSQRVTVANCTLSSHSAAVRVGFAGADIRDCVFANLLIHDSNRGLAVCVRGLGSVEDVLFSDIVIETRLFTGHWWGKGEPIHISAVPWDPKMNPIGQLKNVRFRNILARSQSGILVYGCQQSVIKDLVFQDVKVRINNGPLQPSYGGNFDLRGCLHPALALFAHDIPAFYGRYVDGVKIQGLDVEWADDVPAFFTHAIQFEDFHNIAIDAFTGGPAHHDGSKAAIAFSNGSQISIRNSRAAKGTGAFVSLTDVVVGGLFVNNDLAEARKVCDPESFVFQASGNRLPGPPGDKDP